MPSVAAVTPRKMWPPPTTMAISTPSLWTATISSAMLASVSASMPVRRPPIKASPESFSRMRLYFGRAPSVIETIYTMSRTRSLAVCAARDDSSPSLQEGHDFRGEVVASLLDALTQLEAREARDGVGAAGILARGF